MPEEYYSSFVTHVTKGLSCKGITCYYTKQSDFPDLRFGLAPDNTFPLRASDYVSCSKWGECVAKFQMSSGSSYWILGDVFMRKWYVKFDVDQQRNELRHREVLCIDDGQYDDVVLSGRFTTPSELIVTKQNTTCTGAPGASTTFASTAAGLASASAGEEARRAAARALPLPLALAVRQGEGHVHRLEERAVGILRCAVDALPVRALLAVNAYSPARDEHRGRAEGDVGAKLCSEHVVVEEHHL